MRIDNILKKRGVEKIIFEHELHVSGVFTTCIIKRKNLQPIMTVCGSYMESLNNAAELLDKVISLEKQCAIVVPDLEKQPYNLGYYREIIFQDYEIEFKRIDNIFYIKNLRRKTADGFYIVEDPYNVPPNFRLVNSSPDGDTYHWDELGFSSGTAGEAVVKDGKVIKTKITAMS